jgi:hypothetical protein
MNVDHLVALPDKLSGHVVSVKPLQGKFSFIIRSDASRFTSRSYVSDSGELLPPATIVVPGNEVLFLPGSPRKNHKMPRAYSVEIIRKTDNPNL